MLGGYFDEVIKEGYFHLLLGYYNNLKVYEIMNYDIILTSTN